MTIHHTHMSSLDQHQIRSQHHIELSLVHRTFHQWTQHRNLLFYQLIANDQTERKIKHVPKGMTLRRIYKFSSSIYYPLYPRNFSLLDSYSIAGILININTSLESITIIVKQSWICMNKPYVKKMAVMEKDQWSTKTSPFW